MHFKRVRYILILLTLFSCKQPELQLIEVKHLPHYPSGSALAFYNSKLYLIGDDTPFLMVLDDQLEVTDSILIYPGTGNRITKEIKPDLEAMAMISYKSRQWIMVVGSGSVEPYREQGMLIFPGKTSADTTINLHLFYKRIKEAGIPALNIEGLASFPGGIIFSNRGNKNFTKNHLVFTDADFFSHQETAKIQLVKIGYQSDTAVFNGISGLDYAPKTDKLLLTVSTENTYNSYSDGAIGKSYLWILNDISTRKKITHLNPDRIIDLGTIDHRFAGHKIESVCIISETRKQMELILAADDDKGDTWLFRLLLKN